ncbi:MAG: Bax inhibitor-1/YccA family protein [Puniceicoccales bacterium]|jgi:uncharacterized YccA/Bax inhibitor family protein|nr:Bax inhibitor-1/YccA family protein [Puniceicoccales bacterium]
MNYERTSNPVFQDKYFNAAAASEYQMTVSGTITKTSLLLMLTVLSAAFAWTRKYASLDDIISKAILFSVLALVCSLVTCFKPLIAKYTAPLYAVLEGLVLGSWSLLFEMKYHGIVIQATMFTFGVFGVMLFIYRTGIIKVNEKFAIGLFAATAGIAVVYLMSLLLRMFGVSGFQFLYSSSNFSIGFSVFVVIIAALNLVMDFDYIVKLSRSNVHRDMEWFAAFGLLVTLVWLYIEILRLLAKLSDRRH